MISSVLHNKVFCGILLAAILVIVPLSVFWQVGQFAFLNYDDNQYVWQNPYLNEGLTWKGIRWAFSAGLIKPSPYADYWQPITFISRLIDVQCFGLNPAGHHRMNLLIHILNGLLVFFILWRLTATSVPSFFVALYFSIHPLQVEAVAWITARKDLLSSFFGLLAIGGYVYFRRKNSKAAYFLSLLCFLCGILAKPTVAILPCLLILLDIWPLGDRAAAGNESRCGKPLFANKIPFFVLAPLAFIAFRSQPTALHYPWHDFLPRVLAGYLHYIERALVPLHLGLYGAGRQYTLAPLGEVFLGLALLGFFSILSFRCLKKNPRFFTGWFWFFIGLIPVIGLSPESDRYMYLTGIGLWILLAWGVWGRLSRDRILGPARAVSILTVLGALWAAMSLSQLQYWRDDERLCERSLEINPHNYVALNNQGNICLQRSQYDRAIDYYRAALREKPDCVMAYQNIAAALGNLGRYDEAIDYYNRVLQWSPNSVIARCNLANILFAQGKINEARDHYAQSIQINPDYWQGYHGLGEIALRTGNYREAQKHFLTAARLRPQNEEIQADLSIVQEKLKP